MVHNLSKNTAVAKTYSLDPTSSKNRLSQFMATGFPREFTGRLCNPAAIDGKGLSLLLIKSFLQGRTGTFLERGWSYALILIIILYCKTAKTKLQFNL